MKILRHLLFGLATLCTIGANAQTTESAKSEENYEYRPHFFIQAQGGAAYTLGENTFGKLLSPTAAINFGYKFIPEFGIRIGASGWQAKGSWVAPRMDYKYNYVSANLDAMLSLTNLFCGFNPKRTLDFYAFIGAGFNHAFNNDEAIKVNEATQGLEYLWTDSKNFIAGRGGLGVNIRLSNIVAINVEVNANGMSDHFNSKRADNADWQFNGLVGLTFNLGKNYRKSATPIIEEEMPIAPVAEEPAEEPATVNVVEEQPKVVEEPTKTETIQTIRRDIFFLINSAKVRESEQVKIDELVEFLNEHPTTTITVTGYADQQTGTSDYNMNISERRANAVAELIIAKGIAENRVTVAARGDKEQPFSIQEENRVAICITE